MSKTPPNEAPDTGAPEVDTLEHETFLARWSKRKTQSRAGIELPEPADEGAGDSNSPPEDSLENDEEAGHGNAEREEREDAELRTAPAQLPPIESLGEDSDYSAFLASDVPEDLQRQALRKMFQSPKFNVRDGLDDYDLDFSSPEPLGDIVTAEMRHRLRVELERLAGIDDESSAEDDRDAAPAPAIAAESEEPSADNEPDDDEPATA